MQIFLANRWDYKNTFLKAVMFYYFDNQFYNCKYFSVL